MSARLIHRALIIDPAAVPDLGPILGPWLSKARLSRVHPVLPELHLPAAILGLEIPSKNLHSGPVLAATFKVHPPERSTIFHLSLLSVDESGTVASIHPATLTQQELHDLASELPRLASKNLTAIPGKGLDHLLVWEDGSLDLHCHQPTEVLKKHWQSHLPQGDGEPLLRQFIEDSLDLLDNHPFNRRRRDEGQPKANILWPHSFGFQTRLPNLALQWGRSVSVVTQDLVTEGTARLAGLPVRTALRPGEDSILRIPNPPPPTANPGSELEEYMSGKSSSLTLQAIAQSLLQDPATSALLLVVQSDPGLALLSHPNLPPTNSFPFDPRVLDDTRLSLRHLPDLVTSFFQFE